MDTPIVHYYTAHIRIPEFFDQHMKALTLKLIRS